MEHGTALIAQDSITRDRNNTNSSTQMLFLTQDEQQRLHHAITKQGLTRDEIADYAESIFGCPGVPKGGAND